MSRTSRIDLPSQAPFESRLVLELVRFHFGHPLSRRLNDALDEGKVDWRRVRTLAIGQGVAPICFESIAGLDGSMPALAMGLEAFRRERQLAVYRSLRRAHEIADLLRELECRGVRPILLKGASLAHAIYPDPTLRPMVDIDLLLNRLDLQRACGALEELGYRSSGTMTSRWHEEYIDPALPPFFSKGRLPVEIHFKLYPGAFFHYPDEKGVWDRAVPMEIGGSRALRLSAADELLYLCSHILKHRYQLYRLIWYVDLALLARGMAPDDITGVVDLSSRCRGLEKTRDVLEEMHLLMLEKDPEEAYGTYQRAARAIEGHNWADEKYALMAQMTTRWHRIRFMASFLFPRLEYLKDRHGVKTTWGGWVWRILRPFWVLSQWLCARFGGKAEAA